MKKKKEIDEVNELTDNDSKRGRRALETIPKERRTPNMSGKAVQRMAREREKERG